MVHLIDKDVLVAEIERKRNDYINSLMTEQVHVLNDVLDFLDTLEVKEVDEQKERMSECPYRKVGCTMYKDKILECKGACSWVVDYPRLKELKAQKGEEVCLINANIDQMEEK